MGARKKIVIGLVGKKGAGKDIFYVFLRELLYLKHGERYSSYNEQIMPRYWINLIKSSDILIETLKRWGLPVSRENMQKLVKGMESIFEEGTLSNAIYPNILDCSADIVVFNAIRWPTDIKILRKFHPSFLIYIVADEKIRYERIKNRGEKPEENNLSFDQFKEEEKASTEVLIEQLGAVADLKIENNGTLEQFAEKVKEFYDKNLKAVI